VPRGDIRVLQAFFYVLNYPQTDVVLKENINENTPEWNLMRKLLSSEELYTRIKNFNCRSESNNEMERKCLQYEHLYNRSSNIQKILDLVDRELIIQQNYVLNICFDFVSAALSVKQRLIKESLLAKKVAKEAERKRLEDEAEAKRLAEEAAEEERLRKEEEEAERREQSEEESHAEENEEQSETD